MKKMRTTMKMKKMRTTMKTSTKTTTNPKDRPQGKLRCEDVAAFPDKLDSVSTAVAKWPRASNTCVILPSHVWAEAVRRYNLHETLVASLAWIVSFCEEHGEWFGDGKPDEGAEFEWLDSAQKLLEKAKEK
jgi:hypothetical protein